MDLISENKILNKELGQICKGIFQIPLENKKDKVIEESPGLQGISILKIPWKYLLG